MDNRLADVEHRHFVTGEDRGDFRRQTRLVLACNIDQEKLAHCGLEITVSSTR